MARFGFFLNNQTGGRLARKRLDAFVNALRFNDARNSQFVALLIDDF